MTTHTKQSFISYITSNVSFYHNIYLKRSKSLSKESFEMIETCNRNKRRVVHRMPNGLKSRIKSSDEVKSINEAKY